MTSIFDQVKPWLVWIHAHPDWVGVATFLIVFIECLAVVGLLIPGTVFMTALGAMVGSGVIPAHVVFISAMLGALAGDVLSFWIGYHQHEHLREIWPFKFYPKLLQKGEAFFYKHGGKGIFIARFLGPIRPLLPIIAGMLNMPPLRFLIADCFSAVIWVPVYMLPGIILGAASIELAPRMAMHLVINVILILLILWCISWLIKKLLSWVFISVHNALGHVWLVIKQTSWLRPLSILLQDYEHPEGHTQLTLGLYFIFITSLFIWLLSNVLHQGSLLAFNTPLLYLLRSLHNSVMDRVMVIFTLMGEGKVMALLFLAVQAWLIWIRAWRTAIHWFVLGILCFGGVGVIKHGVHSLRPTGLVVTPQGYSFPSGHATLSATMGGFLAVLIAREIDKSYRWIPYTVVSLIVLGICLSRLYLGAHWLTDVFGGLLLASMIVMIVTLSYHRNFMPKLSWLKLSLVAGLTWLIVGCAFTGLKYHKALHEYSLYVPARTMSLENWWSTDGAEEPLYRLDRTGKPAQMLNVQWVGYITYIEENLITEGWSISTNTPLGSFLNRLSKQNNQNPLPLLPALYLDQRPVLVMIKPTTLPDVYLVLRLWDGKTKFDDSDMPLWLGNVSYYHVWQTGIFHLRPEKFMTPAISPIEVLENDLENQFTWKQVSYKPPLQPKLADLWWDGQVVLIKS